jgi:stage II sporulation protein D
MVIRRAVTAVSLVTALLVPGPVAAQDAADTFGVYRQVELVPSEGTTLTWNGRTYAGSLIVRGHPDGLTVIEQVSPEDYLLGIQEMPFSWPIEALRTQAVAARTYLAWTLARDRAGAARRYGFDICASSACQVYRGLDLIGDSGGSRWAEAVATTTGEVLLYEEEPALTLYSSTTGGRTSSIQDVYTERQPVPYLQSVESPGESSPFVEWSFLVPVGVMAEILEAWGELPGRLREIEVVTRPVGEGPWMVRLTSDEATETVSTWEFRGVMNRWGPEVAPELLPGRRPDGKRYPQVILAPTYTVVRQVVFFPSESPRDFSRALVYRFRGGGWGHTVGMSQFGARAMAEAGATYEEILGHYYSGLFPDEAGDALPDDVAVGLAWGEEQVRIRPDGPVTVIADGKQVIADALGSWEFRTEGRDVIVRPPVGLGLPLAIRDVPSLVVAPAGSAPVITFTLSGPAEVRLVVFEGPGVAAVTDWTVRDAGSQVIVWDALIGGDLARPGRYRIMVEARSPEGSVWQFTTVGIGARPGVS